MKVFSFVWGGPWTSSLEGCHPSLAVAGCLDILFVHPDWQCLLPEVNREGLAELWCARIHQQMQAALSQVTQAKPREKLFHSIESAGRESFRCKPIPANASPSLDLEKFLAAIAGRVVCREKLPSSG